MWGLPLLLWGLPGVAKTAILREISKRYSLAIEVLSPACRGEGAFGVTPVPAADRMTYPRPDWTDRFERDKRGIVFVDEINLAASHYAGALLGLLADRVLGSYQLPPGVRVLAAANPPSIAAASGGWDLSAPAANRVGHVDWSCPDVREWSDWLLGRNTGEEMDASSVGDEEARVMAAWPAAWAEARGVVTGFLSAHSTHLHAMPTSGDNDVGRAWPSPRTWEYAARAWAGAAVHNLSEVDRDEFVSAFVGTGAAGELLTWWSKASLPNSEDLLDGRVQWKHNPARLDVTMAVFGSAAAVCVSTVDLVHRKTRAERMWQILAQAADSSPDLIVAPAKSLAKAKLLSSGVKTLSKLAGVLAAANIRPDSQT